MSSKSRNKPQKPRRKQPAAHEASAQSDQPHAGEDHEGGLLDNITDEVLHVPKESSKLRFILMILCVIGLLIIFVVPSAFSGLGGGGAPEDPEYFSWDRPGAGTEIIGQRALGVEASGLQTALGLDIFLAFGLGIDVQGMELRDAARFHVLDALAFDAGVRVPMRDLGEHLSEIANSPFFRGTQNDLRGILTPEIEDFIRRGMRIKRFIDLVGYAGALAGPADIVDSWEAEHTELALDYIAVDAAEFEEDARAELPEARELETWFGEQPENVQNELASPEQRRLELVSYAAGSDKDLSQLLEAFPPAEEVEPDARAEEYYNQVFLRRFVREVDENAEEDADAQISNFLEFAEVKELCLAEAPVYNALQAWLSTLKTLQAAGTEIDLLAESQKYGLSYLRTKSMTRDELAETGDFKEPALLSSGFYTQESQFAFSVSATGAGLAIVRVSEVTAPVLPAFTEIQGEVADKWVANRLNGLAMERLEALQEAFEEFTPEDEEEIAFANSVTRRQADLGAFLEAMTNAGFEVERRDWLDFGGPLEADPLSEDADHEFLHSAYQLRGLEEGEVAAPMTGTTGDRFYLVRCDGRRPVAVDAMSPRDFNKYVDAARSGMANRLTTAYDQAYLRKHYALLFASGDDDEEADAEAEASE